MDGEHDETTQLSRKRKADELFDEKKDTSPDHESGEKDLTEADVDAQDLGHRENGTNKDKVTVEPKEKEEEQELDENPDPNKDNAAKDQESVEGGDGRQMPQKLDAEEESKQEEEGEASRKEEDEGGKDKNASRQAGPQEKEKCRNNKKEDGKNPYDSLKWIMVMNDGKPDSLIKLVALKSLFAKQLPKMPRTYIARLVFDRRHTSLAILSDDPALKDTDEEVIGSICYRAFPEMRFAEIAFCAVNASHQVKVSALKYFVSL